MRELRAKGLHVFPLDKKAYLTRNCLRLFGHY